MSGRTELRIRSRREGDVGLLHLEGEVRSELVARLHAAAETLRADGARHLLLDVGQISFIDSASVGELVRLDALGKKDGGKTILFGVPRIVLRVLDVTGLQRLVLTAADEASARALLRA
jgi:anti-sigma B factor antagonist